MNSRFGLALCLGVSLLGVGAMAGCDTNDGTGGSGGAGSTSSSTTAATTTSTSSSAATSTSSTTGGGPTADEACAAQAAASCAKRDACTNGYLTTRDYGDVATCESRQKEECLLRLSASGTSLDVSKLEACAAALPAFSCGEFLNAKLPSACMPDPGAVVDGGACAFAAQCASTYCKSTADAACGVCAALPKAGDSCVDDTGCGIGSGLRCAAKTGICVLPGGVGAACEDAIECRNELSCVVPSMGMPGTCQTAGAAVGAACDAKAISAPDCDRTQGLRCAAGQCAAVTFADAGEACGAAIGAVCADNGACLGPNGAKACVAAVADGAACDTEAGPPCSTPAHCFGDGTSTAGVCALTDASVCK